MAYTDIDDPTIYFNTVLYTGNATARSITGVGFQPDWLWIKKRSESGNHRLVDSVRGATKELQSDNSDAEATTSGQVTSFDSDGFSLGTSNSTNKNSITFSSWNWKAGGSASSNSNGSITSSVSANTTAGFSIVSYTGNATNAATVGHGLGVAPKVIIFKNRSSAEHWRFHNTVIDGSYDLLYLNLTNAKSDSSITAPTSSVFTLDAFTEDNGSGNSIIAYCFAEKKGYSKFGSYTGNGNADGSFVYTGFKPAWVMIKQSDEARDWVIYDNKRDTFNVGDNFLVPNSSNAEGSGNTSLQIDFLSNGFKLRGDNHALNKSGASYIYLSFAESPFVNSNGIPNNAR